jgi:hypothetical protein
MCGVEDDRDGRLRSRRSVSNATPNDADELDLNNGPFDLGDVANTPSFYYSALLLLFRTRELFFTIYRSGLELMLRNRVSPKNHQVGNEGSPQKPGFLDHRGSVLIQSRGYEV